MAGLNFAAVCPENSFSTSLKTMLVVLAPTNQKVKLKEWAVSFIGTNNAAQPVKVQLYTITSGGSLGTGTSVTMQKMNPSDSETVQTTGNCNCSAEPSGTKNVLMEEEVHPQTGYTWQAPFGGEVVLAGGKWLGLCVTAAAGTSCAARLLLEE